MRIEAIEMTKFGDTFTTAAQQAIDLSKANNGMPVRFTFILDGQSTLVDANSDAQTAWEFYELSRQRARLGLETPEILIPAYGTPVFVEQDTKPGLVSKNLDRAMELANANQQIVGYSNYDGRLLPVAPGDNLAELSVALTRLMAQPASLVETAKDDIRRTFRPAPFVA